MDRGPDITVALAWSIINRIPSEFLEAESGVLKGRGEVDLPREPTRLDNPEPLTFEFQEYGERWTTSHPLCTDAQKVLEIYGPLAVKEKWILGQLGQSLDGRIATEAGDSHYVTGDEDLIRLHRIRSMADAVIVGANTVTSDNPKMTVRMVKGSNPVRVILDPQGRLDNDSFVFQDRSAKTIVLRGRGVSLSQSHPDVQMIDLDYVKGEGFGMSELKSILRQEGYKKILVEGGGVTVSRFLQAGALDRLHITVAPMIIGSGRHGLELSAIESLSEAIKPKCRQFKLGNDVLFDLNLRS